MSTLKLMTTKRFAPFFFVQFFGAMNDNIFKNTILILLTFKVVSEAESATLASLAGGLFILPFFLFSGVAGQIADKNEKSYLMRLVKLIEIPVMIVGAISFFISNTPLQFITLFLMGTLSAFFGPVKYSILPQHLTEEELVGGNSLVELGTFLAILIGTIAGGLLAGSQNMMAIAATIISVALASWLIAKFVPVAPAGDPGLKLNWNPFTETTKLYRLISKKEAIFNSIVGISWLWFFGAIVLSQLPIFVKHVLHADASVVTLLLAVFSISIGIGSILTEKLSRGMIELGIVPIGALGLTIFTGDLYFINYNPANDALITASQFWAAAKSGANLRIIIDFMMIGIFFSMFMVPLFALIQIRSDEESRSRVIAANNIFNSVFMVVSAIAVPILISFGNGVLEILLITAILNFIVSVYIFTLIPEFFMRFVIWVLAGTIYRVSYEGRKHIPTNGSAILVCNHISFIDWFIITAGCGRPVIFVMDHQIFKIPVAGIIFKLAKAIPIAPAKEDPEAKEKAFKKVAEALADNNIVCIFPEGKITYDGNLNPFKTGVEVMLKETPVPVIPMALTGLWGSFFSREKGGAMKGLPHPSRRKIKLTISAPLPPTTTAADLEVKVKELMISEVETQ
jgi:1-acyl-sn-glycerol-3-phosphate acyltransferase